MFWRLKPSRVILTGSAPSPTGGGALQLSQVRCLVSHLPTKSAWTKRAHCYVDQRSTKKPANESHGDPMTEPNVPTKTTRRALMRGAAWTAPIAIASVAAPALAVSPDCATEDVSLNWGFAQYSGAPSTTAAFTTNVNFNPTPSNSTFPSLNTPMTATILHTYYGRARGSTPNGTISTFNVGGIGQVGYYLRQQIGANGNTTPATTDYQTIRFTFSEPIRNLRFSITDIDRAWTTTNRDFIDGVSLTSSAAFTSSVPSGSQVTGAGTASSPWQNSTEGNKSEDGPGGQIDITFTGTVQSFTIRYDNLGRQAITSGVNNDQAVFVTGFRTNRHTQC